MYLRLLALHNYMEFLALIISFFYFSRLRISILKTLPYFLLITVIIENTSIILSSYLHETNTSWLYNIFIGIQIYFFHLLFLKFTEKRRIWNIFLYSTLIYSSFYFINISIIQGPHIFNHYSYLLGSFFIIVNSSFCFFELIERNLSQSMFQEPFFWINSAALLFFTGTFIYFLFWYYLVEQSIDNGELYRNILTVLNLLFYSLIIISITWQVKKQR